MATTASCSSLRRELERHLVDGRCAYCRRKATRERPLTREHAIPLSKGGRRRNSAIIIPACARCNHRRGCLDLSAFLLLNPRRISALLDFLYSLSPASLRELDARVLAELYAAVWVLSECAGGGRDWRRQLRRMCSGRALHRRRYAARRVVTGGLRRSASDCLVHVCPVRLLPVSTGGLCLEESLEKLSSRLLGLLVLMTEPPAWNRVRSAALQEIDRTRPHPTQMDAGWGRRSSVGDR